MRPRLGTPVVLLGALLFLTWGVALPPAASAQAPGAAYVALGDSFTAGPVIPAQLDAHCQRSSVNYPHLVAAALHLALNDVSCAGAKTASLTGSQSVGPGHSDVRPPQLDALGPATRLVTIGIGGNDVGYSDVVVTCTIFSILGLLASPCTNHYTDGGTDQLAAAVAAAGPRVGAVLAAVHRRSPKARVLLVGYPDIAPPAGTGCWPMLPFAPKDLPYLRGVEVGLNAMLASEAAQHRATFVDTYTPSVGHDACTTAGVKWVEGLIPLGPAAPFHPDAAGEQHMAAAVLAASHR
ncbi:MAG TPA: SGNH/GDSL hydrolase family protein [Actinomycetota bacterium]|nr:SGNH/GDSL hydrolase family protein [Actinomycetota bacterium]